MLTITLKTHQNKNPPGFNRQSLYLYAKFGDSFRTVIENVNQYRGPDSQISKIYNSMGKEIPQSLWEFKIKENLTLYVDRPQNNENNQSQI